MQIAVADVGLGLATPVESSTTVDAFPFTYAGSFRVYNTGDEDGIIVIKIIIPYSDINDWITIDKSTFALKAQENRVVYFNITANEGYIGTYNIIFQPTLLPSKVSEVATWVYLGISNTFNFTVVVPPEVGTLSLGERPPGPKEELTTTDFTRQLEGVNETGVIVETFGKTIILNVPSDNVKVNMLYGISVSFLGGGEPVGLGFLFASPSGTQIRCAAHDSITFNEPGEWIFLVLVEDQMILGKAMVVSSASFFDPVNQNSVLSIMLIAPVLLFFLIFLKRRKDRGAVDDKWPELPNFKFSQIMQSKG